MSTGLHATAILVVALLTTVRLTTASDEEQLEPAQLARLVFVAEPEPGGGGGGGGLRMPPPLKAERKGTSVMSRRPMPGRPKTASMITVPESRNATCKPSRETTGIRAFRSA